MDTQEQLALACTPHSVFPWEANPLDQGPQHTHALTKTVEEADFLCLSLSDTHYQCLISAQRPQKTD